MSKDRKEAIKQLAAQMRNTLAIREQYLINLIDLSANYETYLELVRHDTENARHAGNGKPGSDQDGSAQNDRDGGQGIEDVYP